MKENKGKKNLKGTSYKMNDAWDFEEDFRVKKTRVNFHSENEKMKLKLLSANLSN